MTKIFLQHSTPAVIQALGRTLQAAWPGLTVVAREEAELFLSDKPDGFPTERTVILENGKPQKLVVLIRQLQAREQDRAMPKTIALGQCRLDTMTRQFHTPNAVHDLTEKEMAVIAYLAQRGSAATREDLLRDVWRYAADADTHTIETHIYRLRQKIEAEPENPHILLTTKDGYQLAACSSA